MILDVSRFKNATSAIEGIYNRHKAFKALDKIANECAVVTHVHIIATAYIIAKLHGSMTQELQDQIDRCKAFYRITEIVGVEQL